MKTKKSKTMESATSEEALTMFFDEAYDKANKEDGGFDYVALVDLRKHLKEFPRKLIDNYINNMRRKRKYVLAKAQGKAGGYSKEELDACIEEAGITLMYISRL